MTPPESLDLPPSPRDRLLALAWGVMLTLCVTGYTFGQSNHHVYLLDALRFDHAELLARDWFTTHTLQYHFLFTRLTVVLRWCGLLTAGFFVLYLGLVVAMHAAWWSIVRSIGGGAHVYLLSVLLYHLSGGGLGLGVYQILQDGSFLPSNVAAVACLGAMAFYFRDLEQRGKFSRLRPGREADAPALIWPTALCVAVAGLFHVNYAMACIAAWVGLSLLAIARDRSIRPTLRPSTLAAAFVALAPCVYAMLVAAWAARERDATITTGEFVAVYVRLRHSHHHEPLAWPAALWISFLWPLPFAVYALAKMPASRVRTGVAVVLFAVLGVLAVAFTFAGVWYVSGTLVKLSLFRFSPFAKLLTCVLTAWLVMRSPRGRVVAGYLAALLGGGILLGSLFLDRWPASVPRPYMATLWGTSAACIWLSLAMVDRPAVVRRRRAVLAASIILALPPCVLFAARQRLGVVMPGEHDAAMADVCRWAREETDRDALFLVPPQDQSFTLAAERAQVVSFKHVPQLSREIVEWKRRLGDVLDANVLALPTPLPRTLTAIGEAYRHLSGEHLADVAHRYDCDYVIAMRRLGGEWTGREVYASPGGAYHVYRTR